MTRSQLFTAAHRIARTAHVAGDCYRVTFAAALREVRAGMVAPMATHTGTWTKVGGDWRAKVAPGTKVLLGDRIVLKNSAGKVTHVRATRQTATPGVWGFFNETEWQGRRTIEAELATLRCAA